MTFKERFFSQNTPLWKTVRTITQALIGIILANIDVIANCAFIPDWARPLIVGIVPPLLTPLYAAIGRAINTVDVDDDEDYMISAEDLDEEEVGDETEVIE